MTCQNCGKEIQLGETLGTTYWYHSMTADVYCYPLIDEPADLWHWTARPTQESFPRKDAT